DKRAFFKKYVCRIASVGRQWFWVLLPKQKNLNDRGNARKKPIEEKANGGMRKKKRPDQKR
ncbi:MAG: hypothetical protein OET79_04550, partial [Nitrospirota bacterium]|nr:hypothetical protein [Nitrospirota bacterium]